MVSIHIVNRWSYGWNINSDKLILNWLANRTPPSCIRVNLLFMASEEIKHWKETAEEMRESYEESIHLLTPRAIEKSWIKNLNKKGTIVPATVFMSCLTHTNTLWCLSILVTGGYM